MEYIDIYKKLLTEPYTEPAEVNLQTIELIDAYPTFVPPYLDQVELFEGLRQRRKYRDFLQLSYQRLRTRLCSLAQDVDALKKLDYFEIWSINNLLYRILHTRNVLYSSDERLLKKLQSHTGEIAFADAHQCYGQYMHLLPLQPIRTDTIEKVMRSITDREHLWYGTFPKTYHHHAQEFIILRAPEHNVLGTYGTTYKNVYQENDPLGVLTQEVIEYAKTQNKKLGVVRLFSLLPYSMVYLHSDKKDDYDYGQRYHVILHAPQLNTMFSGTDHIFPKVGQFWSYDNTVAHRSYNYSNTRRINLIFDLYT